MPLEPVPLFALVPLFSLGLWVIAAEVSDPDMGPEGAFSIYAVMLSIVYLPLAVLACMARWMFNRRTKRPFLSG